jgi:hypothetical protein
VVESGTLAGKLAAGNLGLADDVVSRDHDGVLDPGESGLLRVTVVNAGPVAAEQVVVTATTPTAGVKIGAPLRILALAPFSSADLTIPVSLAASAPPNASLAISVKVVAENTCDRTGVTVVLTTTTGNGLASASASPAMIEDSRVVATYQAPAASLDAVDAAVCIANDTP